MNLIYRFIKLLGDMIIQYATQTKQLNLILFQKGFELEWIVTHQKTSLLDIISDLGRCVKYQAFSIKWVYRTVSFLQPIKSHQRYSVIVYECSSNNKTVKDLMAVKPNINFSRKKTLRNATSVKQGPGDVKNAHQYQPTKRCFLDRLLPAIYNTIMSGRSNSTQTKSNEDT